MRGNKKLFLSLTIISLSALGPFSIIKDMALPIPLICVLIFAMLNIKRSTTPIEWLLISISITYGIYALFNEYYILRSVQSVFIWLIYRVAYGFFRQKENLIYTISAGLFLIPLGTIVSVWYFINVGIIPWSSFTNGEYSSRIDLFELPSGWSSGPVEFGYTIAPWLPLFVYYYFLSKNKVVRLGVLLAVALILGNLLFIGSRSALLALGISFFIFIMKSNFQNKLRILAITSAFLFVASSNLDFSYLTGKIEDVFESQDSRISLDMMIEVLRIVHYDAPFGYHFNTSNFDNYLRINNGFAPHNFILSSFWEGGLIIGYTVVFVTLISIRKITLGILKNTQITVLLQLPLLMLLVHGSFHNNSFAITSFIWPVFLIIAFSRNENRLSINGG